MDRQSLEQQLASLEAEMENAKVVVYRCDGAIQVIRHLLTQIDEAEKAPKAKRKKADAEPSV